MAIPEDKEAADAINKTIEAARDKVGGVSVNEQRQVDSSLIRSSKDMRKLTVEEFEEAMAEQATAHTFTFMDLVLVFMGSQIITAGIIWVTILIQRGTW